MTTFSPPHQQLLETVPAPAGADVVETVVPYEHDGAPMEGYAAHDASVTGPKPAVLVIHDWTGLQDYPKVRAQMLARLGYYAFAPDLYGAGRRFDTQEESSAEAGKYYGDLPLMRERVRAGYDQLVANPDVDASRIAVIGYCFGGSAALEFARTGAAVAGTMSFHGALIAHEPADVDAVTGPIVVATGGSDPVVPDDAVLAFENELRTREDLDWQVTVYSGAPHAFTLPGPMYRETADRRSWRELTGFLAEVFA